MHLREAGESNSAYPPSPNIEGGEKGGRGGKILGRISGVGRRSLLTDCIGLHLIGAGWFYCPSGEFTRPYLDPIGFNEVSSKEGRFLGVVGCIILTSSVLQ